MRYAILVPALLATAAATAAALPRERADACLEAGRQLMAEAELVQDRLFRRRILAAAGDAFMRGSEQPDAARESEALVLAARCYHEAGDDDSLGRALAATMLLAARFPDRPEVGTALVLRGRLFAAKREWGRAVRAWMQAAEAYPATAAAPEALVEAARVFQEQIRNTDQAVSCYDTVVGRYADSEWFDDALCGRAGLKESKREFGAAIDDYLRLVDECRGSALADKALFNALSICEDDLREYKRAYELAVRFRKEFPHSEYAKRVEKIEAKTLRYAAE